MRKFFDKSPAIDAASNLRLVTMIQNHDGDYSARELEILEEGEKMLDVIEQQKSKALKMASPTSQAKMPFKDGSSHAYGWSSAIVRASPARVLAFIWDTNKRAGFYVDDLEKTVDEDGDHNKLVCVRVEAMRGNAARHDRYRTLPLTPILHAGTSRRRCPTRSTTGTSCLEQSGGSEPRDTSS
jgi:hypothetical protein